MPSWRNIPSIPKVRASSGTIGTTCLPIFLSLARVESMRTKAMVVESSRLPLPLVRASKASRPGISSGSSSCLRSGRYPPNSLRRSWRYLSSSLSFSGQINGISSISASETGILKRSRKRRICSSPIFFWEWVAFCPSPASPIPYPLTVLARITVGCPLCALAAL